jgi:hypothetical protein
MFGLGGALGASEDFCRGMPQRRVVEVISGIAKGARDLLASVAVAGDRDRADLAPSRNCFRPHRSSAKSASTRRPYCGSVLA